jgi:hypothetical protein
VIRRRIVVVTGILCAGAGPVTNASAHNGIGAAFKGRAGHYVVYAYDGELLPTNRLDYRLVLLNGASKNPVYDAHPTVTADRSGTAMATASVTTFGNVFFYNLPNPYPHDWNVHLRITGPLGKGAVTYRMHGAAQSGQASPVVIDESALGSSTWPYVLAVFGAAVLAAGAVFAFMRRRGPR